MSLPDQPVPGDRSYADKIDAAFEVDDQRRQEAHDEARRVLDRIVTGDPLADAIFLPTRHPRNLADALALFQSRYPTVTKGSEGEIKGVDKNGNPFKYRYNYANLADMSEVCLPLLGECGLAWSCLPTTTSESPTGFGLRYALLFGATGEERGGVWPLPDPIRTSAHAMGSATTYAKRYAFSAATGVAPAEDDDDAREAQAAHKRREAREDDERAAARQRPAQPAQQATQPQPPTPEGNAAAAAKGETVDQAIAGQMAAAKKQGVNLPVDWFPGAWQSIVATGDPNRPSPFRGMPWFEVFGGAFAASIEGIRSLPAYKAFMEEIRKACDGRMDRSATVFPWPHEGIYPADRATARREALAREAAESNDPTDVRGELEQLLAGARTPETLASALQQVTDAARSELITSAEEKGLIEIYRERERSFQRRAPEVPKGGTDGDPWATTAPEPDFDPSDPWATTSGWGTGDARPVQDVELPSPEELRDGEPADVVGFEDFRLAMRALDANDADLARLGDELEPAHLAGDISAEDAATLYQWLQNRPRFPESPEDGEKQTSQQRRDVLIWQADTSMDNAELDDVRDANNALRTNKLLTVPHSSKVAAAISARRTELARLAGKDVSA